MENVDALRIWRDHADVLLLLVTAYAVAAWMLFESLQPTKTDARLREGLGRVKVNTQQRQRQIEEQDRTLGFPK